MSDYPEQERSVSKYNVAVAKLQILISLWSRCHTMRLNGNYEGWNKILDSAWAELSADEDSNSAAIQKIAEFNARIAELQPLAGSGDFGFNKPSLQQKINWSKQYTLLMEKEIYLRKIEKGQGKGMQEKQDEDRSGIK